MARGKEALGDLDLWLYPGQEKREPGQETLAPPRPTLDSTRHALRQHTPRPARHKRRPTHREKMHERRAEGGEADGAVGLIAEQPLARPLDQRRTRKAARAGTREQSNKVW